MPISYQQCLLHAFQSFSLEGIRKVFGTTILDRVQFPALGQTLYCSRLAPSTMDRSEMCWVGDMHTRPPNTCVHTQREREREREILHPCTEREREILHPCSQPGWADWMEHSTYSHMPFHGQHVKSRHCHPASTNSASAPTTFTTSKGPRHS